MLQTNLKPFSLLANKMRRVLYLTANQQMEAQFMFMASKSNSNFGYKKCQKTALKNSKKF